MEIITKDANETYQLGQRIGSELTGGEVLALSGDLGAGKTTFMQGLAQALEITDRIISPTFILMRSYEVSHQPSAISHLYHLDLYRLEEDIEKEVQNLGIHDLWEKPENIVVIEWAEKAKAILPSSTRWINFEHVSENERKITISH